MAIAQKLPTINDVAAAAGVSRQTVTRALNDMADVSPATRQRVMDAAEALHYRPNRAAQRLVRGRDVTIGFVVGDLRNPYYPELASELSRRAAAREWGLFMVDLSGHGGAERVASVADRVDALIGHLPNEHRSAIDVRTPTVLLADDPVHEGAWVRFDYERGMRDVVAHLLSTGRRRIAVIDADQGPSMRMSVLGRVLAEHGLEPVVRMHAPVTHRGGVAAAAALADGPTGFDAVLCFNDVLAVGALKGFAMAGIHIPQDVAVVGIDGLDIGTLVTPELTTLAVDMPELADRALELAEALLAGRRDDLHRTVDHTLVLRESA
ncbi:LacI family DNA-binding transcriptional regulator [Humibacter soli]